MPLTLHLRGIFPKALSPGKTTVCLPHYNIVQSEPISGFDGATSGYVAIQVGTLMAGTDKFYIRVNGVGGHGGTPHLVKDTVLAACAVVMNLQPLISRETDPTEGGIVGVTLINSGKLLCLSANDDLEQYT